MRLSPWICTQEGTFMLLEKPLSYLWRASARARFVLRMSTRNWLRGQIRPVRSCFWTSRAPCPLPPVQRYLLVVLFEVDGPD